MKKTLPVMPAMCKTCPFRKSGGLPVRELLEARAVGAEKGGSPICHSTGEGALKKKVFEDEHICRGARNLQLQLFAAMGFIESATDAAWEKKWMEIQNEQHGSR